MNFQQISSPQYIPIIDLLWFNPEHLTTNSHISSVYRENILQRDLTSEIHDLQKEIESLEQELIDLKPKTVDRRNLTYFSIPDFRLKFSGIDPSYYKSCIECLAKRDLYPEIFGFFNCTCTSNIKYDVNQNTFGFISCICNSEFVDATK